jgi:hypothetical protein
VIQSSVDKFLGVFIDDGLKFGSHISSICGKLSKSIGIMNKLKNYVPGNTLIQLYYSFVYPYLIYCNQIWGGTFDNHLKPLITLQKRIILIITNQPFLAHTNQLFYDTKILKIPDIHIFLLAQFVFKSINNQNSKFSTNSHNHNTRTRANLLPDFQRLSICQHSINYRAPHIWNSLPAHVKDCPNISISSIH